MKIAESIIEWYHLNGRPLPWRETRDSYKIWISEVILQQTRIAQGTAYYQRFIERFPDIESLAGASIDEVMKYWEGLGYYSRARNLHAAAIQLMTLYNGNFPEDYREIIKLKGLGRYSARAVGSFAFDNPVGVIDGNVLRVMSRVLNDFSPVDITATLNRYQEIIDEWVKNVPSAPFNHGIMDIGSTICTPTKPACILCPLEKDCLSVKAGSQAFLPVKSKKLQRETRYFHFYWVEKNGSIAILRRPEKGIWGGLYEIPNEEVRHENWEAGICRYPDSEKKFEFKHVFTHFDMHLRVFSIKSGIDTDSVLCIPANELKKYAFPKAVNKIIQRMQ
ncbi:MAG: A/G-specific adenine glycosylase [Bacteroidia bacterium]|nr:A/G-specific adenine glycosylase [Bacteroidia bacterium]